jgi:hypothetical protein
VLPDTKLQSGRTLNRIFIWSAVGEFTPGSPLAVNRETESDRYQVFETGSEMGVHTAGVSGYMISDVPGSIIKPDGSVAASTML